MRVLRRGLALVPPDGAGSVAPLRNWSNAEPFDGFEREVDPLGAQAAGAGALGAMVGFTGPSGQQR